MRIYYFAIETNYSLFCDINLQKNSHKAKI